VAVRWGAVHLRKKRDGCRWMGGWRGKGRRWWWEGSSRCRLTAGGGSGDVGGDGGGLSGYGGG